VKNAGLKFPLSVEVLSDLLEVDFYVFHPFKNLKVDFLGDV